MIDTNPQELITRATHLSQAQAEWHFHFLAPSCTFNHHSHYALILEDITADNLYVAYTAEAPLAHSNQLAQLLHGESILDTSNSFEIGSLSTDEVIFYNQAARLAHNYQPWHHHLLFPRCHFNDHPPMWTMLLEDFAGKPVAQMSFRVEPTTLLSGIERLFYD